MKHLKLSVMALLVSAMTFAQGENENPEFTTSTNLKIESTSVVYDSALEQLIFTIDVEGTAGASIPTAVGQLDGAPVLGYVFPTTLSPTDVGFSATEGIVAMALTSHPDFDDTPLWDENLDRNYANDGVVWHPHWVVLASNDAVPGGLAVKMFNPDTDDVTLPPTNPGMPMYMDSPGFNIVTQGDKIRVIIPAYRMNNRTDFNFDAVAAYMEVNTSNTSYPMLGVYAVYSVASGDLSLPYTVTTN